MFGALRDPYHRVDVHESSRPVTVTAGGGVVARSERPKLLFETGLAARVYLPRADVAAGVLAPAEKRTICPYKGEASYWSVAGIADAAWSYEAPLPEAIKVRGPRVASRRTASRSSSASRARSSRHERGSDPLLETVGVERRRVDDRRLAGVELRDQPPGDRAERDARRPRGRSRATGREPHATGRSPGGGRAATGAGPPRRRRPELRPAAGTDARHARPSRRSPRGRRSCRTRAARATSRRARRRPTSSRRPSRPQAGAGALHRREVGAVDDLVADEAGRRRGQADELALARLEREREPGARGKRRAPRAGGEDDGAARRSARRRARRRRPAAAVAPRSRPPRSPRGSSRPPCQPRGRAPGRSPADRTGGRPGTGSRRAPRRSAPARARAPHPRRAAARPGREPRQPRRLGRPRRRPPGARSARPCGGSAPRRRAASSSSP